jgi:AcrR family transcriptional regulator
MSPSVPLRSRRERHRHERRARIREAAYTLFRRRGYAGTTVDAIAERADVARGTFFNHYASKEGLLSEYYDRLSRQFLALLETAEGADTGARLKNLFTAAEKMLRAEGPLFETLYREVFLQPSLIRADAAIETRVLQRYELILREGQARGELRRELEVALGARVLIDLWAATLRTWLFSGRKRRLAAEMSAKVALLLRGMRSR